MRILHIATRHIKGGAARNLRFTLDWELQQGNTVHLAMGAGSDASLVPAGVEAHVLPHLVRSVQPATDALGHREIERLIERLAPDVVHTHQSKAGILGRLAARRRAAVIVHTVHMAAFGPGYSRPASLTYTGAERLCARFTDFFVTVGMDLCSAYLAAGVGTPDRYHVIHSPLGVEEYLPVRNTPPQARLAIRKSLDIAPDLPVIAGAGLLEPRKRFDLAIQRLAPLLRRGAATLVIAGEGPEAGPLKALATSLNVSNQVRFLGYVDTLPQLFSASDLFVHASSAEGVPQVVVQALAAGLPVVATTVEGLGDLPSGATTVVDRDGVHLQEVVERTLAAPAPQPVDATMLSQWTETAVAARLETFHVALSDRLAVGKRNSISRRAAVRARSGSISAEAAEPRPMVQSRSADRLSKSR